MNLCYDEAVQAGLNAYRTLEYAVSCRYSFRNAAREFKEYMEDMDLPYSPELAQKWVNDNKQHWIHSKFKISKKAMSVLAEIIEHGCVTTSLQTKIDRTPRYFQLPSWSRTILDNYLETLKTTRGASYLSNIRNSCSRFFLYLESSGIRHPYEITHDVVKSFISEDIHASSLAKDRCNNAISHCLRYMADQGLILKTTGIALNKLALPDLIIVTELQEAEHRRFAKYFYAAEEEINHSREKYDLATTQLFDILKLRKYSKNILKSTSQATTYFRNFMDINLFAYSNDLALEWLELQRAKWSHAKYLAFRRALMSINEIMCTGTLSTSVFRNHKPKYSLPGWGDKLLSQYIQERKREGCVGSTLDMIQSSCSRFIVYLDKHGIVSEKEITPEIIKDFQAQDSHSTAEGKNAYAIKIRGFLRFLARKGLVTRTLELAISTEVAPHTSIVTTLSDRQIDAIYTFRQTANDPIDLRSAAIIMLGLRMGLRGSDISNLQLTDISWEESTISFIQQKTGVHLKLPMPVDVGNSLYRYVNEGRPQTASQHVFVQHRAPYGKIKRYAFGKILKAVLISAQCEATSSFHMTRKTFASKLLSAGNTVSTIAAALGHVGVSAVDEYLAANEKQMRLCAIGLKGIEYSGRFSL